MFGGIGDSQEAKDREVDLVPQMLNETPAELLRRKKTHAKNKKTKDEVVVLNLQSHVVLIGQVKRYFAYESRHQRGAFDMTGGCRYFLFSPRNLRKISILTSIFFKWVESTN